MKTFLLHASEESGRAPRAEVRRHRSPRSRIFARSVSKLKTVPMPSCFCAFRFLPLAGSLGGKLQLPERGHSMLARFRTCLFFFRCSYSISEVLYILPARYYREGKAVHRTNATVMGGTLAFSRDSSALPRSAESASMRFCMPGMLSASFCTCRSPWRRGCVLKRRRNKSSGSNRKTEK